MLSRARNLCSVLAPCLAPCLPRGRLLIRPHRCTRLTGNRRRQWRWWRLLHRTRLIGSWHSSDSGRVRLTFLSRIPLGTWDAPQGAQSYVVWKLFATVGQRPEQLVAVVAFSAVHVRLRVICALGRLRMAGAWHESVAERQCERRRRRGGMESGHSIPGLVSAGDRVITADSGARGRSANRSYPGGGRRVAACIARCALYAARSVK